MIEQKTKTLSTAGNIHPCDQCVYGDLDLTARICCDCDPDNYSNFEHKTDGVKFVIDAEGSELLAKVFNRMTTQQKENVPDEDVCRIADFMYINGYAFVFTRWYKQRHPLTLDEFTKKYTKK